MNQDSRWHLVVLACAVAIPACTALMGTVIGWPVESAAVCLPAAAIVGRYWRWPGVMASGLLGMAGFLLPQVTGGFSTAAIPWGAIFPSGIILTAFAWMGDRQRELVDRAYQASGQDALTGLLNRGRFLEVLNSEANRARRSGAPLAVAFIDLDNFKQLNDTQGHHVGDQVIQAVAEILKQTVRDYDGVARLGGDEFALFYPATDEPQARMAISRLEQELLRQTGRFDERLSYSIGVAVFLEPASAADHMLQEADRLMYQAKHSGKGRAVFRTLPTS
jgi:diguanylate cyclase (GGDEF)-like protein